MRMILIAGLLVVVMAGGLAWVLWLLMDSLEKANSRVTELVDSCGIATVEISAIAKEILGHHKELVNEIVQYGLASNLLTGDKPANGADEAGMDRAGFVEGGEWGPGVDGDVVAWGQPANPWAAVPVEGDKEDPGERLEAIEQMEGPNPPGYEEMLKREGWEG